MKLIDKMQFIVIVLDVKPIVVQYEKTCVRSSKKNLWIMTHTRKDKTLVDVASGEVL